MKSMKKLIIKTPCTLSSLTQTVKYGMVGVALVSSSAGAAEPRIMHPTLHDADVTETHLSAVLNLHDHHQRPSVIYSYNNGRPLSDKSDSYYRWQSGQPISSVEPLTDQTRQSEVSDDRSSDRGAVIDGIFTHQRLSGLTTLTLRGRWGGWQIDQPVELVSSALAGREDMAQAISLNLDEPYKTGTPGAIHQDIILPETQSGRQWQLNFDAGNSTHIWCSPQDNGYSGEKFTGEQRIKVRVSRVDSDQTLVEKQFTLGVSRVEQSNEWMSPEWRSFALRFVLPEMQQKPEVRVTFASASDVNKACGALVTQIQVSPDLKTAS